MKNTICNVLPFLRNAKNIQFIIVVFTILSAVISLIDDRQLSASTAELVPCKCVIFRFDDIRNGFLEKPQMALMNFFISNNQSVSLGIIASQLNSNTDVYEKVKEGYEKGLFEVGIHGWNHEDYTKLTGEEQQLSLMKANQKLHMLFGNYSRIFIPPFNLFNNDTISAIQSQDISILSSAIYYDSPDVLRSSKYSESMNKIFHIPEMTDFSIFYNGIWVKVPLKIILSDIDFDIKTYGYSVIMLHPHNFATQVNGSLTEIVDYDQIKSLKVLLDVLIHKKLATVSFSQLTGITQGRN